MTRTTDIIELDGTALAVRPIVITDAERLARFFTRLSDETVHFRFFSGVRRAPRAKLLRLADVDHDRRDALVALDGDEIVAVARYDGQDGTHTAEIAITVEDAWQRRGLGKRLARRLASVALDHGYDTFVATMLADNRAAVGLVRHMSPDAALHFGHGEYEAVVPLRPAS